MNTFTPAATLHFARLASAHQLNEQELLAVMRASRADHLHSPVAVAAVADAVSATVAARGEGDDEEPEEPDQAWEDSPAAWHLR